MLEVARENTAKAGLPSFETRQGTAEEIPLESASVDLVVSQSSFHEWEEPKKGLSEIYRVLAPGGSLILKDYNLAWLSNWKRKLIELVHPLHMFKFRADEVATLLREAGFDPVEAKGQGVQYCLHAKKGGEEVK
jgi:ubiquinone/menaquinone biosynthesis C-methylase UbiE